MATHPWSEFSDVDALSPDERVALDQAVRAAACELERHLPESIELVDLAFSYHRLLHPTRAEGPESTPTLRALS